MSLSILEFWAYIGDVLGVYNRSITAHTLLATAQSRVALRRLGHILGYNPRPAVGTTDQIAAFQSKDSSVGLSMAAFRAAPSNSLSAQVFEVKGDPRAESSINNFVLAPLREDETGSLADNGLLLEAPTAGAVRGRPVMFAWLDKIVTLHATEITNVAQETGIDGQVYIRLKVASDPQVAPYTLYTDIVALSPSQKAYARTGLLGGDQVFPVESGAALTDGEITSGNSVLGLTPGGHNGSKKHAAIAGDFELTDRAQSFVELDSVYRSISTGDYVIVQYNEHYSTHQVTATKEMQAHILIDEEPVGPLIPITRLTLYPAINAAQVPSAAPGPLIIHYNMHDIGRLMRPAYTELTPELVLDTKLALEGIHSPIPNPPTEFILEDANGRGVLVEAKLEVSPSGAASLTITDEGNWTGGLRVPVKAYGNVVHVTRGETVENEVLGDGDQSQPYQTFQLARSPLTYLPSDSPRGIASTLEVRVDGVLWHERPSFYGARPTDPVYIVRHDDDQNTSITFGDGVRGLRLPTGSRNIRATYRHGAGADAPPPGGINQIAKGVPGLMYVRSPIQARGGADAESIRDIRRNAPASALVLGRCVSLADYSARVAGIPGIRNSKVEYAWDAASLTAGVKVWYVPNNPGTDMSSDIVANLQAMSEPGLVIRAAEATPVESALFINVEIDPDYLPADIEAAVQAALLDPETGLLAPENTPIGGPLSRSAFVAVARAVPGVLDVTSVQFGLEVAPDSFPAPGLRLPAGHYFNFGGEFAGNVAVGAVRAESRGCRDLVS